jgi:hypothetical protein
MGHCHDMTVAAVANLIAYLGWLRGGEIIEASSDNLVITAVGSMCHTIERTDKQGYPNC